MDWIEFGKVFGFPSLIFAVWYIYHASEVRKWEHREVTEREKWEAMLSQVKDEQDRNFELLRDAIENVGVVANAVKELAVELRTFKERFIKS